MAGVEAPQPASRKALHAIALFEALKGFAALAALVGLLDLLHHDVRQLAIELIGRFGLNPDAHYPSLLLHYADLLPGANLRQLVLLGTAYVSLRLVEAYGLWNDKTWGEKLAALSGALYIPFELAHLLHRTTAMGVLVFVGNLLLVAYLVLRLWRQRRASHAGELLSK
ncbi:Uncharacterized membrane protein, DUF2068 family [Rhodoferax sp. OV413]|uniref:DUF2127 domain-containing protein n=1 Tax=Rhodoferax sp. OV413 TaxID=1855285 RepID=UPI0008842159|nr:DUF2127 domain-containing protein [Rhodoferax sp. OV413]SDP77726.1 Uncharacterized membrane protein, DUF2068 family [Rhodoferax sp. OV413]